MSTDPIGIVIETTDDQIKPAVLGMITAVRHKDATLTAFVLDGNGETYRADLENYGIHRIVDIIGPDGPISWHPDVWTLAILDAMNQFNIRTLAGLTSSQGRELLPRIAAKLKAPLAMDCLSVDITTHTTVKSRFSGKTTARLRLHGDTCIYGIRPNAIKPRASPAQKTAKTVLHQVTPVEASIQMAEIRKSGSAGPDLSEAEIIISGGRAMGSAENYTLIEDCADALGAAAGASRAAVDAGYAPYRRQVGQTGVTVSPKLYIACGISGAIQHFAGMKTAGVIVSINTDKGAPMARNCDYFLEGDLFEIVPLLTRMLRG